MLGPLRKRLAKRYTSNESDGPLVRALEGLWVDANDGPALELVFVLKPGSGGLPQIDTEDKIRAAIKVLLAPIFKRANATEWKVSPKVVEASELTGHDLLYRLEEVGLDLPRDLSDA